MLSSRRWQTGDVYRTANLMTTTWRETLEGSGTPSSSFKPSIAIESGRETSLSASGFKLQRRGGDGV